MEQAILKRPGQSVGAAGEAAAAARLRLRQHGVFNVNEIRESFPVVDLSYGPGPAGSPGGFASVKNYDMAVPGELRVETASRYARDFKVMLKTGGPGYAPVKAEKAGELMFANRARIQAANAWPGDLPLDASPAQITRYINEKGTLVIPDDHVGPVRKFIREQALRDPGAYELENAPDLNAAVERLQERVQPMGITSDQLNEIHNRVKGLP